MSRVSTTSVKEKQFIERLVEVCGTDKPTEIARLFNISYQAAKNYLGGRLPDTTVLLNIAKETQFSLHWLLTGEGKKFVDDEVKEDTLILSDQIWAQIRNECRQIVSEMLEKQNSPVEGKVIVINANDIKDEKVLEKGKLLNLKHE